MKRKTGIANRYILKVDSNSEVLTSERNKLITETTTQIIPIQAKLKLTGGKVK
jgi:hypothetical protein